MQPDVAGGPRVELGEQPGDGGLARAGLADQGGDPAPAQGQARRRRPRGRPGGPRRAGRGTRPADREVLGEAVAPRGPPRWSASARLEGLVGVHAWSCRSPQVAAERCRPRARPCDAMLARAGLVTGQDFGLSFSTISSAFCWVGCGGAYGFGLVRPADPVLGAVLAADVRGRGRDHRHLLDHDLLQRVQRRGPGRVVVGVGVVVQRLGRLGAVEPAVVAGDAAGADRLEDRAVHDVLVDVVRRGAAVGPVHARRRSCPRRWP